MSRSRPARRNRGASASVAAGVAVQQQALGLGDQYGEALRSLKAIAPTLYQHPDVLHEVKQLVKRADSTAIAFATGNAYTGLGSPAVNPALLSGYSFTPDLLRAGGITSPTQSTPQASSPAGQLGGWAGSKDAPKGVMNARVLRNFARDPWVFAGIKHRKERVARAAIDVLPLDYDKKYDREVERKMKRLLNSPNPLRDSWSSLIRRVVDDIMVLDRGCISKSMTPKREPLALWSEDGATIKIYANWDGNPKVPRYLYEEPGTTRKVALRNDELICIMESETTYSFGQSRVQILLNDIEADIQATEKAKDFVLHKPAQHAIQIPGAGDEAIRQLRSDYETLIAGKREILFLGGDAPMNAKPLVFSLRDQQFMEWQTYLMRKICAVLQVSPQSLGFTMDVNRANGETQQDIEDDAGNIPLLLLLEEYLNRELLWDYARMADDGRPDFETLNLGIFFPEISEASRIMHVERLMQTVSSGLAGAPYLTPNMAMEMLGEEPLPGGNTTYIITQNGAIPFLSYDGETGDFVNPLEGGALGDQLPGSGPDENERDHDDSTKQQEKPAQQQGQSSGDASSGSGSSPAPNAGESGNASGGDSGDSSQTSKAGTPTPPMPPMPRARRDRRMPGKAWAARDVVRSAATLGYAAPDAPPQRRLQRSKTVLPPDLPPDVTPAMARDIAKAVQDALILYSAKRAGATGAKGEPTPVGHVDPTRALIHHKPHAEVNARANLEAQIKSIFEDAQQRGHLALTSPASSSSSTVTTPATPTL